MVRRPPRSTQNRSSAASDVYKRPGLYCANTLSGKLKPFPITKGRFNATKRVGSVLVFRLKGRFVTSNTVAVGLLPRAVCDGVGGSFTLKLSSSG